MSSHNNRLLAHKHPSDLVGAKIAMWLFLFTEILLFGGLFILYAVYRAKYPNEFHVAAYELDTFIGAVNTLILLTSSLTVVLSIEALKRGSRRFASWMLAVTVAAGGVFLYIKLKFEWAHKFHLGIFPGSEQMINNHSEGEIIFYNLYYAMTGLHGVHVLVGMGVLVGVLFFIVRKPVFRETMDHKIVSQLRDKNVRLAVLDSEGKEVGEVFEIEPEMDRIEFRIVHEPGPWRFNWRTFSKLENSGLYWHLVDVIWIFLFPLFYLIT